VKRIKGVVMLIPKKGDPWQPFVDSLDKFSEDFMSSRPDQGSLQKRNEIE
jgi:virulence-associated protein VagC